MIEITKKNKDVWLSNAKRYVKKPIVIRAVKINDPFLVETLEGDMRGKSGDYLVEGIKGEVYPVAKDIFKQTYKLKEPPCPKKS